ncbi:hypothetical protein [Anabaena azotica]|uniref:Uncharacterized protein n=1 Tax=Anabaena azotica FACHB-119 TaxID=947527 RepID=A0ABR8DE17_9NOST|nr:hypothetical protein [Anabaena azotica]MBD2505485.1 hypothetical protein [Anabaena azotica FACHB-119]
MRSTDQNLLVLTIYIIGVTYVFNQMISSIDERIKYNYKKAVVDDQLKQQELDAKIDISFKFSSYNSYDEVKELSITIENKSDDVAVYVDWDNSSIVVEHTKQSRRVIRRSPDLTRDLAVPQSPSLIVPKKSLSASITAEDVLKLENGTYSVSKPLIDITGLKSGGPPQKKLYGDFINRGKELEFSLQLVMRLTKVRAGLAPGAEYPPISIINCPFTIKKLPWTYALPWNKKK